MQCTAYAGSNILWFLGISNDESFFSAVDTQTLITTCHV